MNRRPPPVPERGETSTPTAEHPYWHPGGNDALNSHWSLCPKSCLLTFNTCLMHVLPSFHPQHISPPARCKGSLQDREIASNNSPSERAPEDYPSKCHRGEQRCSVFKVPESFISPPSEAPVGALTGAAERLGRPQLYPVDKPLLTNRWWNRHRNLMLPSDPSSLVPIK